MNIAASEDQNDDEYDSESDYSESEVIGPRQTVSAQEEVIRRGDQDEEQASNGTRDRFDRQQSSHRGPGMNRQQQEYDDESDEEDSEELLDNGGHDDIEADDEIEEVGTQFDLINEQFSNQ